MVKESRDKTDARAFDQPAADRPAAARTSARPRRGMNGLSSAITVPADGLSAAGTIRPAAAPELRPAGQSQLPPVAQEPRASPAPACALPPRHYKYNKRRPCPRAAGAHEPVGLSHGQESGMWLGWGVGGGRGRGGGLEVRFLDHPGPPVPPGLRPLPPPNSTRVAADVRMLASEY